MKKYFVLIVMMLCVLCTHAHAGLLDDGFTDIKNLANKLEIKTGEFYDAMDDELHEVVQVSLISYKKDLNGGKVSLGSLDLGYTTDDRKAILSLNFNIIAISKWVKKSKLDKIPLLPVDIFISIGAGWDFTEEDTVAGTGMVGFKFEF